jgi:hypothetical protein
MPRHTGNIRLSDECALASQSRKALAKQKSADAAKAHNNVTFTTTGPKNIISIRKIVVKDTKINMVESPFL